MQLYAIRHLPTAWNQAGKLQGTNDIDILTISENDQLDIDKNNTLLEPINFDIILVSSLKRTHQTAQAYGIDTYKIEPLVNELNFGKFEGLQKAEMLKELGTSWFDDAKTVALGEPLLNFENRLLAFIKKYEDKKVLLFAHGAVIRGLLAIYNSGDINKMNQEEVKNNALVTINLFEKKLI